MIPSSRRVSPHGTRSRYAHGCRCADCREASRVYHKRLRERRLAPALIDSTGPARRLRALHAAGWSWAELAARVGHTKRWPSMLARQEAPTVTQATFKLVDALWRELRDTPGPSVRARSWARKHGWPPPEYWAGCDDIDSPEVEARVDVDWVAVELALKGKRVGVNRLERLHAVHAGRERGMSYSTIAGALHMSLSRVKELGAKPLPEGCEVAA